MSLTISRSSVKRAAREFVIDSSEDGRIVEQFFSSLDTPKSLAAYMLFKHNEHAQLLDLDVNPLDYLDNSADVFHRDYLAVKFLSKSSSLKTGYNTKDRGLTKFFLMEEQCKITNRRFKSYSELENSEYATWLFVMRRKIDLILGDFDIEKLFQHASWGPGVTTFIKGDDTSATRKFQSEIGITNDAYALFGSSIGVAYPNWFREEHVSDSSFQLVSGNTITSVPKNSKTDRIIAVEPGLNLYFQKGIGRLIKERLRKRGVDLTNQSINQKYSLDGSLSGNLATVDFSSASDTIAWSVVHKLLPDRWFTVMNSLRSKSGTYEGRVINWEKFSSMGNGFTFELESLLFYAAALATCEMLGIDDATVSVYGDDVIIPSNAFVSYGKFCEFLGFTVNHDKSFYQGWFRESCGSHYFRGVDVKPIFHKEALKDAFSVYKLANSIRRLSHRRNSYCGCDVRFLGTWRRVLQRLPNALRCVRIPEGYGDGGLASNFDEACPPRLKSGWEGFDVMSIAQRSVSQTQDCIGLLNERLTQIQGSWEPIPRRSRSVSTRDVPIVELSTQVYGQETSLRDRTVAAVTQLVVPSWYNFGGWE